VLHCTALRSCVARHAVPFTSAGDEARSVGGRSHRSAASSVNGGLGGSVAAPSPARWWVLGLFSTLSALQCVVYLTFGPVSAQAQAYWPLSNNDISLLALMSQVRPWGGGSTRSHGPPLCTAVQHARSCHRDHRLADAWSV
jgi:hypothetical protein